MTDRLAKGFLSLFSARVVGSFIGLVTLPFVVRVLGPKSYGDYAFLMSTFSMMMLLVSPAVTEGVQKFIAESRGRDHWEEEVAGFYVRLALLLAIPGSLLLALVTWSGLIDRLLGSSFNVLFYILAIQVVTTQLSSVSRHTLLGLGLEEYSEGFSLVKRVVSKGLGLGLALLGFGVAGFLVGHIASSLVFIIASVLVFQRKFSLSESIDLRLDSLPVKEFLKFNGYNIVLVVLMQSLFHTDVMMIRYFTGGAETGYYKSALVLAEYLWIVPIALQQLMLHSASELWSQGRSDRIQELMSELTRYVFLLTTLLAIGVGVLADSFVPIYYGAEFQPAVQPLLVLLPGAVGFALARPIYGVNQAAGRLKPLMLALGVSAVLNLVLNYVLIPEYGMAGAAFATSVSYGSMLVLQAVCALYVGYSPLAEMRPVRLLVTVVIAGAVISIADIALGNDLLSLAVIPPAGLVIFVSIALVTGALRTHEIRRVIGFLPAPIQKRIRSAIFWN